MFDHRDILIKAASRIEEEGMWCQGQYFAGHVAGDAFRAAADLHLANLRVPECALGAMASAAVELGLGFAEWSQAGNALERHLNSSPPTFNDAPGRTAHEVAMAMRGAAL